MRFHRVVPVVAILSLMLPAQRAVAARDPRYEGLARTTHGPCAGMFEVVGVAGLCTHGPDDAPAVRHPQMTAKASVSAQIGAAVLCDGDGQSGNRVQLMYLHPPGLDRYAALLPTFQMVAAEVDAMYNASAQETGGTRHVRYVTAAGCTPTVLNVQLSDAGLATFGAMVTALQNLGYNRIDRKYLLFTESTVFCGLGSIDGDSSPSASNRNNIGPDYARVDRGCWENNNQLAIEVAAHELGHNLGAVQNDAPHATGLSHCTDEHDRMCGDDGSGRPPVIVCPDPAHDLRFDCNHDDYFSTNPVAGGYLASHWNLAMSSFLIHGGPSAALSGDWDGIGGTGVGVAASYGGFEWEILVRDEPGNGPPSITPFRYGSSACRVLTGDWNGDGATTTGVVCKDGIEWRWSLRDFNSGGTPSYSPFKYGNSACVPVTGDWDGNGSSTIGVVCKDGVEWRWSLRNANNAGAPSIAAFKYGNNACVPVTGDWDGNGSSTIGVVCKDGIQWRWNLRNTNGGGAPSYSPFGYGNNGCTPVTGDWNGDGTATAGVACKGTLLWEWSLINLHAGGVPSYPPFRFGNSS